jgi:hypothetical protein
LGRSFEDSERLFVLPDVDLAGNIVGCREEPDAEFVDQLALSG